MDADVRAYGWYCYQCKKHTNKLMVAKARGEDYTRVVCADCATVLLNCFVAKKYLLSIDCTNCSERFQCFTNSSATVKLPIRVMSFHLIKTLNMGNETIKKIVKDTGVQTYTGFVNDKLDGGKYCYYPEREDCNFSHARVNYAGEPYDRCEFMYFEGKSWFCSYGRGVRANEN